MPGTDLFLPQWTEHGYEFFHDMCRPVFESEAIARNCPDKCVATYDSYSSLYDHLSEILEFGADLIQDAREKGVERVDIPYEHEPVGCSLVRFDRYSQDMMHGPVVFTTAHIDMSTGEPLFDSADYDNPNLVYDHPGLSKEVEHLVSEETDVVVNVEDRREVPVQERELPDISGIKRKDGSDYGLDGP